MPSPKGLAKLGNIVAETLFLVVFSWVVKLAENKQNAALAGAPGAKREDK